VHLVADAHDEYPNRTVELLFNFLALHPRNRAIGVVLPGSLDEGLEAWQFFIMRGMSIGTLALGSALGAARNMPERERVWRRAGSREELPGLWWKT
jgi:hypothetical protein